MPHSSVLLAVDALAGAAVLAYIALHVRRLKKRPKAVADLMDHQPLAGQDKWLGGVLGADGCVYGVPGHAKHVLKLDPVTAKVSLVGGPYQGKYKWLRGATAPDGCIYCIPCHADKVLKIDCTTGESVCTTIGDPMPGEWKWHGGVLSPHDGCIYGIPQFAQTVLKIDPATQEVSTFGGPFPGASPTGKHKWYGGLLSPHDGCIYGIPQCAVSVIKIDPKAQQVTTIGELPAGGWKWHGGVTGPDGCIYGIPANADTVLKVDPKTQEVLTLPFRYTCHHRDDGKYKYLGGVLGPDGRIYCIPSDADRVLRIDPATNECVEMGETLEGRLDIQCNKWQNGFLARDGRIYGIPLKAESVLCIDVASQTVYMVGGGLTGFEKWEGGVLAGDGAMYCIPLKSKYILKVNPEGDGVAVQEEESAAPVLWKNSVAPVGAAGAAGAEATEAAEAAAAEAGEAAAAGVEGAARRHDALLGRLSGETELGRLVRDKLCSDGYVVLRGVLGRDECAAELERMWRYVAALSPAVRRDDPESWYAVEVGGDDPWPHSGWKSFSDMFQTHAAGWLFGELREKLAVRVFEPLYGTRELHTSKEGFSFLRPTAGAAGARHPSHGRKAFVCGKPSQTRGEHFDQGHAESGLQYIQSSTCLVDQEEEDACFLCWPGSHTLHQQLTETTWRGRSHWVPLTDAELEVMRAAGLAPLRVPVQAGDVVLWRSDLAHSAAPPPKPRPSFRAVSYTCMLPAALTPPHVAAKKAVAYRQGHTGDHAPDRECWHASKLSESDEKRRGAFFADGPPQLTQRQAELYGLMPYGQTATPT